VSHIENQIKNIILNKIRSSLRYTFEAFTCVKKDNLFLERSLYCSSVTFLHYAFGLRCYSDFKNPSPSGLSLSVKPFYTERQTAAELQENLTRYMPVLPAEAIEQVSTIIK
jgi:hypothetical protein